MRRRVVGAHLVENLGFRLERAKAMREADGNEELRPVLCANDLCYVLSEGRGAVPQIDRNVKDGATHNPNELVLGEGRNLEMKTADDAARFGEGIIVLDKITVDAGFRERATAIGFGEEAALVAMAPHAQQLHLRNAGRFDDHGLAGPVVLISTGTRSRSRLGPRWQSGAM